MSVCADLGFSTRDFIEQAYFLFTKLIDEKGVSHFEILQNEYQEYKEMREKNRYLPRMSEEKHAFVVTKIHEEVWEHLDCIKDENHFKWIALLRILLMIQELEMNKIDQKAWEEWLDAEDKKMVKEAFAELKFDLEDGGYSIDKTELRRKYERSAAIYPESGKFKWYSE